MLQFLSSLLISILTGFFTVTIFWRSRSIFEQFTIKICLSTAIGLGISSCIYFITLLFFGNSVRAMFTFEVLTFIPVTLTALFLTKDKSCTPEGFCSDNKHSSKLLSWGYLLAFVYSFFSFLSVIAKYRFGNWDAWLIWNLHAKFLFICGNNWKDYFHSNLNWTHPDYPLLLPGLIARGWHYIGFETFFVPIVIALIFTFCTGILLYSSLSNLKSKNHGYLAGIILLSTPFFIKTGTTLCADTLISFFLLATLILFFLYSRASNGNYGLIVLAGITSSLGAWCKNEGLLMILIILIARSIIVIPAEGWKTYKKEALYFITGLLPVLTMIIYFKMQLAPVNDLFIGQNLHSIVLKLTDPSRYGLILSYYVKLGWLFTKSIINPFTVLLFMILAGINVEKRDKINTNASILAIVFMLGAYFTMYLVTPHDLNWHLNSSLNRLFMQLWPSFIFTCFMMI